MKKYWHNESVYTLYDENSRLFGIIGYSQIAHEDQPDIKFARFLAYTKPLWSDEFVLAYTGDIRWDGLITGTTSPISLHSKGMDDLLSTIFVKFAIYDIAYMELYVTYIKDKYKQKEAYEKMTELFDSTITYRSVYEKEDILSDKNQKFCDTLKNNLTEMSSKLVSNMEDSFNNET